jgi:hypothetical protein
MLGGFIVAASSSRRDVHVAALFMFVFTFAALVYFSFSPTLL